MPYCRNCKSLDMVEYMNKYEDLKIRCNNCKGEYYICEGCEHVPQKGVYCVSCKKFFCISCWQNKGKIGPHQDDEEDDSDYFCEKCLKKKD